MRFNRTVDIHIVRQSSLYAPLYRYDSFFYGVESFFVYQFTMELLLRAFTCPDCRVFWWRPRPLLYPWTPLRRCPVTMPCMLTAKCRGEHKHSLGSRDMGVSGYRCMAIGTSVYCDRDMGVSGHRCFVVACDNERSWGQGSEGIRGRGGVIGSQQNYPH